MEGIALIWSTGLWLSPVLLSFLIASWTTWANPVFLDESILRAVSHCPLLFHLPPSSHCPPSSQSSLGLHLGSSSHCWKALPPHSRSSPWLLLLLARPTTASPSLPQGCKTSWGFSQNTTHSWLVMLVALDSLSYSKPVRECQPTEFVRNEGQTVFCWFLPGFRLPC